MNDKFFNEGIMFSLLGAAAIALSMLHIAVANVQPAKAEDSTAACLAQCTTYACKLRCLK